VSGEGAHKATGFEKTRTWRGARTLWATGVRISIHRQRPLFSALFLALYFGTGTLIYLVRDRLVINGLIRVPLAALFVLAQGSRFAELSTALLLGYAIVWAASFAFARLRASCNRVDVNRR
jgi:hypothetical protein